MKPLAETNWQFEDTVIGSQDDYISSGVQDRRADLAVVEMLLHNLPCLFRQRPVKIFRNVVPDVFAIYYQGHHLLFGVRASTVFG